MISIDPVIASVERVTPVEYPHQCRVPKMDAKLSFVEQLIGSGLLISTGVDGLYGRNAMFEDVVAGFQRIVTRVGAGDGADTVSFPPTMTRDQLETSGYLKNFPRLLGTVHSFCGHDDDHRALLAQLDAGGDWTLDQRATDLVLTPAACYPLYPMMAALGSLPEEGRTFDICSFCFRREPSRDPARMQHFRQREYVRAGTSEQIAAFRQRWMDRAREIMDALRLPYEIVPANDPFFGRAGKLMKAHQLEQGLKMELTIPVANVEPTACVSFNDHRENFAVAWDIRLANGDLARTGCVGFGLERIALALFRHHGLDIEAWPADVRDLLTL
jgi:seryl-tRNA synthetase